MTNRFEQLWMKGVDEVEWKLREAGKPEGAIADRIDVLRDLGLPGIVSVLGASEGGAAPVRDELISGVAKEVAERDELAALGVDEADVQRILKSVLVRREWPNLDEGQVHRVVTSALLEVAKKERIPVSPRDAERAAELLLTGEFFRDIGSATAAIVHVVPGIPLAIAKDLTEGRWRLLKIAAAVTRDALSVPLNIASIIADLKDGELDQTPQLLPHTMQALYRTATLQTTLRTVRDLFGPENGTTRLALIVYARANGVQLGEEDLDRVLESAFSGDEPDFAPALRLGLERLESQYGDKLNDLLDRMQTTPVD